ncbi:hypothetical protein CR513_12345, partial [Mucuna pruriens]
MPFFVFKKSGMQEPQPINILLQLVDKTIAHPRGVIEDVLIKVDKFIFPAYFVRKLTLKLGDEEVEFRVFDYLKSLSTLTSCNFIQKIDPMVALKSKRKPSLEEATQLELMSFPANLKYAFFKPSTFLPVIISKH